MAGRNAVNSIDTSIDEIGPGADTQQSVTQSSAGGRLHSTQHEQHEADRILVAVDISSEGASGDEHPLLSNGTRLWENNGDGSMQLHELRDLGKMEQRGHLSPRGRSVDVAALELPALEAHIESVDTACAAAHADMSVNHSEIKDILGDEGTVLASLPCVALRGRNLAHPSMDSHGDSELLGSAQLLLIADRSSGERTIYVQHSSTSRAVQAHDSYRQDRGACGFECCAPGDSLERSCAVEQLTTTGLHAVVVEDQVLSVSSHAMARTELKRFLQLATEGGGGGGSMCCCCSVECYCTCSKANCAKATCMPRYEASMSYEVDVVSEPKAIRKDGVITEKRWLQKSGVSAELLKERFAAVELRYYDVVQHKEVVLTALVRPDVPQPLVMQFVKHARNHMLPRRLQQAVDDVREQAMRAKEAVAAAAATTISFGIFIDKALEEVANARDDNDDGRYKAWSAVYYFFAYVLLLAYLYARQFYDIKFNWKKKRATLTKRANKRRMFPSGCCTRVGLVFFGILVYPFLWALMAEYSKHEVVPEFGYLHTRDLVVGNDIEGKRIYFPFVTLHNFYGRDHRESSTYEYPVPYEVDDAFFYAALASNGVAIAILYLRQFQRLRKSWRSAFSRKPKKRWLHFLKNFLKNAKRWFQLLIQVLKSAGPYLSFVVVLLSSSPVHLPFPRDDAQCNACQNAWQRSCGNLSEHVYHSNAPSPFYNMPDEFVPAVKRWETDEDGFPRQIIVEPSYTKRVPDFWRSIPLLSNCTAVFKDDHPLCRQHAYPCCADDAHLWRWCTTPQFGYGKVYAPAVIGSAVGVIVTGYLLWFKQNENDKDTPKVPRFVVVLCVLTVLVLVVLLLFPGLGFRGLFHM